MLSINDKTSSSAILLSISYSVVRVAIISPTLLFPSICSHMNAPVSFRVKTLCISAILLVTGTRTYSLPVFLLTIEGEWDKY